MLDNNKPGHRGHRKKLNSPQPPLKIRGGAKGGALLLKYLFFNHSRQKRDHNLMVTGKTVTSTSRHCGPLAYICEGPVTLDEVHVHGCEVVYLVAKVPYQGQCLEKHLRKDHR